MIAVEQFCKSYGSVRAVTDVSFRVEPGQVLGLVGPNGAGKTTTLRALTGIHPPSSGRLEVCGFDVEADPLHTKQRVAYVPDDPQLFPDLTVEQHLAFIAGVYRIADPVEPAERLLHEFELWEKRRTAARDLSRGMRQKLAICCAYLAEPRVILFDEPLTGLDPRGIRTLKQSIRQRAADGAAIVISSHLLAVVEDTCSHVLILTAGRRRFWGTVDELKETFGRGQRDVTLEEIFFQATEADELHVSC